MRNKNQRGIRITIIVRRKTILDVDNPFTKPLVDALKGRFIADDSPKFVEKIDVQQEQAETPSVTVVIEYPEANGNTEEVYKTQMSYGKYKEKPSRITPPRFGR